MSISDFVSELMRLERVVRTKDGKVVSTHVYTKMVPALDAQSGDMHVTGVCACLFEISATIPSITLIAKDPIAIEKYLEPLYNHMEPTPERVRA